MARRSPSLAVLSVLWIGGWFHAPSPMSLTRRKRWANVNRDFWHESNMQGYCIILTVIVDCFLSQLATCSMHACTLCTLSFRVLEAEPVRHSNNNNNKNNVTVFLGWSHTWSQAINIITSGLFFFFWGGGVNLKVIQTGSWKQKWRRWTMTGAPSRGWPVTDSGGGTLLLPCKPTGVTGSN